MAYEPRGKVKKLIDAMDADPAREWTAADAAALMRTTHGGVHSFIARALEAKVLFRSLSNGRTVLSRKPFTPASCVSRLQDVPTTSTGWKPPAMVCTRPTAGTAAPTPQPTVAPAADPVQEARAEVEQMRQHGDADDQLEASVHLAAVEHQAAPAAVESEVTWNVWEDGDMDLHGLVELENGAYRMPAEAVRRLRKFIAWMPA